MLKSSAQKAHAREIIVAFIERIIRNKHNRKLQSLSINHCIIFRLKKALRYFKSLLFPTPIILSAKDWYKKRLLSTVFGSWLIFLHDEKSNNQLLDHSSILFYKKKSCRNIIRKFENHKKLSKLLNIKLHLGQSYFYYLRSVEVLNCFNVKMNKNSSLRSIFLKSILFADLKCKSKNLRKWIHKTETLCKNKDKLSLAVNKRKNHTIKQSFIKWSKYIVKRNIIIKLIEEKECRINANENNKRNKMISTNISNMILSNFFHRLRRKCIDKRKYNYNRDIDSVNTIKNNAISRWIKYSKIRLLLAPSKEIAFEYHATEDYCRRVIKVFTQIQLKRKRSLISSRRNAFAILIHNLNLLKYGYKNLKQYKKKTKKILNYKMMADFKYDVSHYVKGFKILKEITELQIRFKYNIIKAMIAWKITRLILCIKKWYYLVKIKIKRRNMLLKAKCEYQKYQKMDACKLWLMGGSNFIRKKKIIHSNKYILKVIKIWKYLVLRNKLRKQREEIHMINAINTDGHRIDNSYNYNSSSSNSTSINSSIGNSSNSNKGFDFLRAKPRMLESHDHPYIPARTDSHSSPVKLTTAIPLLSSSFSSPSFSPSSSSSSLLSATARHPSAQFSLPPTNSLSLTPQLSQTSSSSLCQYKHPSVLLSPIPITIFPSPPEIIDANTQQYLERASNNNNKNHDSNNNNNRYESKIDIGILDRKERKGLAYATPRNNAYTTIIKSTSATSASHPSVNNHHGDNDTNNNTDHNNDIDDNNETDNYASNNSSYSKKNTCNSTGIYDRKYHSTHNNSNSSSENNSKKNQKNLLALEIISFISEMKIFRSP